jgi:hypothetical protein
MSNYIVVLFSQRNSSIMFSGVKLPRTKAVLAATRLALSGKLSKGVDVMIKNTDTNEYETIYRG